MKTIQNHKQARIKTVSFELPNSMVQLDAQGFKCISKNQQIDFPLQGEYRVYHKAHRLEDDASSAAKLLIVIENRTQKASIAFTTVVREEWLDQLSDNWDLPDSAQNQTIPLYDDSAESIIAAANAT